MKTKQTILWIAALVAVFAAPAMADSYQGSFTRTLQVSGTASLEVYTRSGDVTIHAGPAGSVVISGKIHVGQHWFAERTSDVAELEKNPPIRQDGSRVKVDYVSYHNISIDYEITVPADATVRGETGSGNLTVEGLKSGLQGHTGSGDVRLDNVAGQVRVETGSGNIKGHSLAGALDARTGSGDIRVEETGAGDVKAQTGSGNIEIRGIDGGVRAESGSGNLELEGKPSASWYARASSGNVDLRLPDQAAFDLDVSTGSGTVSLDHPLTTTIQGRIQTPQKAITGKVRGGGPSITAHTGSGDIRIR